MKLISLSKGLFAQIDDSDYNFISQWKWYAYKSDNTFYAKRSGTKANGKQPNIKMHRQILGITDPTVLCDHADGNGLNNCKSNLRLATNSQNVANGFVKRKSKLIYKCVYFQYGKYKAYIKVNGNQLHLGAFDTEIEAAKRYNEAAIIHFKEFAKLNKF